MKNSPDYSERWIQNLIAKDPSVLGIGNVVVLQQERAQPRAGRLDMLLQDVETKRRYELELQLGATDESHIIRTIEYWDIERKRYPQYDHCAIIVAEDITSRLLNVISLFNGSLPLMAIQMQALKVGPHSTVVFTTVLDELTRGLVDDDEDAQAAPTDRNYWEKQATKNTVALADDLLGLARKFEETVQLKYNKFYFGLAKEGLPFNFVRFIPKKAYIIFEVKLRRNDELDERIEHGGLETLEYDKTASVYRIRLTKEEILSKRPLIEELMKEAYETRLKLN
jgi:hypothetical protein